MKVVRMGRGLYIKANRKRTNKFFNIVLIQIFGFDEGRAPARPFTGAGRRSMCSTPRVFRPYARTGVSQNSESFLIHCGWSMLGKQVLVWKCLQEFRRFCSCKCLFANARPDPPFKYLSNRSARGLWGNATYVTRSQGLNLLVWIDFPALCSLKRFRRSLVEPT